MTRLKPEEATAKRDREAQERLVRPAGDRLGALRVQSRVALTFDDGPDPFWTPRVLDALSQANVRATFFVIAPLALKHPHIVSAALEAGHEVELHCTEHARHTHRSRWEVEADTSEGLRALRSLEVKPKLWRPPWGVLAFWTKEVAANFGLLLAPWSVDTHDWRGDTAPEILRRVKPLLGPGSVVLMHDGLGPGACRTGCEGTVTLVGSLVAHLRSIGCEPTPMTLLPDAPVVVERWGVRW